MAKSMLIDATHPEETRVVVVGGNRLEEFDYESSARKQLKGNIYLAKITRVEPSLQAAFVEYGGSRHGFLPFSEIHPDYYRIPIADREALLAEEAALKEEAIDGESENAESDLLPGGNHDNPDAVGGADRDSGVASDPSTGNGEISRGAVEQLETETSVETVGGDEVEDAARRRAQLLRRYKIQEVIKRRQVILVQVIKEERGSKGAALTTYLSLAGRYCVLMPNTAKGGGISRKISNAVDRRRLKKIVSELKIPEGMAVIVRTAGSQRSKAEIKRDYEYLLRLWNDIREKTLQSTAPTLIHEEANLIKRAIRDLYTRDMDEVLVEGEDGYKAAKAFMKNLMPSHAKNVKLYKDSVPLFYRHQAEEQLDAMYRSSLELKSGGYIVINPTEALVAIDVNSGKATKERHIEETALKTNIEAAQEIARQLRLRDLAGLIVIDFIDMEEARHNREVERKLKEAMRHDRARIQLGRISPFGLLELSRQRLRPSLVETSTEICSLCHGTGHIRSTESMAVQVLRSLESEGVRDGGGQVSVTVPTPVALYVFNEKRGWLNDLEQRYGLIVRVLADDHLIPPEFRMERMSRTAAPADEGEAAHEVAEVEAEDSDHRRSRRRRHRKREEREPTAEQAVAVEVPEEAAEAVAAPGGNGLDSAGAEAGEEEDAAGRRRRRRGKRGGRRRSRRRREIDSPDQQPAAIVGEVVADENIGREAAGSDGGAEGSRLSPSGETSEEDVRTVGEDTPRRRPRRAQQQRRRDRPARGEAGTDAGRSDESRSLPDPPRVEAPSTGQIGAAGIPHADVEVFGTPEPEATPPPQDQGAKTMPVPEQREKHAATDVPPTDEESSGRSAAEVLTIQDTRAERSADNREPKGKRRGWWQRLVN